MSDYKINFNSRNIGENALMQDKMQEWTRILSKEYAKQQDGILIEAINNAIGTDWTIETIKHRMAIHRHVNKPSHELILLDNCPILELLPLELSTERRDNSSFYKTERSYRFLPYTPPGKNAE